MSSGTGSGMRTTRLQTRGTYRWSLEQGDLLPLLLMSPAVLLVGFVMLVPLIAGLGLSLFNFQLRRLQHLP